MLARARGALLRRPLTAFLAATSLLLFAAASAAAQAPPREGPCADEARQAMPDGDGYDHDDVTLHRLKCRMEQVAFDSLRDELGACEDVMLGEMDVEAGLAAVGVAYPESGFLLFDVSDPSQPRFLSWYRGSECEGALIDVDCGAYVDLSEDGKSRPT
jgi:hypothetical protein